MFLQHAKGTWPQRAHSFMLDIQVLSYCISGSNLPKSTFHFSNITSFQVMGVKFNLFFFSRSILQLLSYSFVWIVHTNYESIWHQQKCRFVLLEVKKGKATYTQYTLKRIKIRKLISDRISRKHEYNFIMSPGFTQPGQPSHPTAFRSLLNPY